MHILRPIERRADVLGRPTLNGPLDVFEHPAWKHRKWIVGGAVVAALTGVWAVATAILR